MLASMARTGVHGLAPFAGGRSEASSTQHSCIVSACRNIHYVDVARIKNPYSFFGNPSIFHRSPWFCGLFGKTEAFTVLFEHFAFIRKLYQSLKPYRVSSALHYR